MVFLWVSGKVWCLGNLGWPVKAVDETRFAVRVRRPSEGMYKVPRWDMLIHVVFQMWWPTDGNTEMMRSIEVQLDPCWLRPLIQRPWSLCSWLYKHSRNLGFFSANLAAGRRTNGLNFLEFVSKRRVCEDLASAQIYPRPLSFQDVSAYCSEDALCDVWLVRNEQCQLFTSWWLV